MLGSTVVSLEGCCLAEKKKSSTPASFLKKCVSCGQQIPVASDKCPFCNSDQKTWKGTITATNTGITNTDHIAIGESSIGLNRLLGFISAQFQSSRRLAALSGFILGIALWIGTVMGLMGFGDLPIYLAGAILWIIGVLLYNYTGRGLSVILGTVNDQMRKMEMLLASAKEQSVEMSKLFCRYCGVENKTDAVFCEKCGKKIAS